MPTLTEPIWQDLTVVQQAECDPSAFEVSNIRPSQMTGYMVKLLQEHFSIDTNIYDEQLRRLIWQPDSDDEAAQTRIHIEPSYSYDVTHIQQRPALYVARGPVQIQRVGIRDKFLAHLNPNTHNYEGMDMVKLLQCRHQVICCGGKSRMAVEKLSEEVFYFLTEYGPPITSDIGIGNFRTTGITEIQKMDEDHETYMCGVQCAWTTAHGWTLKPLAPILKSIGFNSTQ